MMTRFQMFSLPLTAVSLFAVTGLAAPPFNEATAWSYLIKQVEFGPRVPGSQGHKQVQHLILSTLSECKFSTCTQQFTAYAPLLGTHVEGVNIIGVKTGGTSSPPIVISAHYDTRPRADMDPIAERRLQPIPGANDGASGVAVLLGIAEALRETTCPRPLALVFFDVEDCGTPDDVTGYCLGSRFMADCLPTCLHDFELGINLDMVGKKNLRLTQELYSLRAAPREVELLWDVGARTAPGTFVKRQGIAIYDDHVPFLEKGKKFINLIDFDYPQWHTMDDSVEQCSSQSLKAVGETILQFLFR